jgi:hypothetical protein
MPRVGIELVRQANEASRVRATSVQQCFILSRARKCLILLVPEAGIEPARLAAGDFESPASTNFTTRALGDRAQGALERRRALYGV